MATGKKSFTAYCDWKETFDSLPDNKAGQLIKHLFKYVNDEDPETEDVLIKAVFAQIKATLKRDLKKWEDKREKNRENAKKRWDKTDATACDGTDRNANDAVRDSVSVSVSDIKKEIYRAFNHLQITKEDHSKLIDLGYSKNQVDGVYDRIENYKQNKKYKSLYLTAKNWLVKEGKQSSTKFSGSII